MELTRQLTQDLQNLDTPTVCNALELIEPRGEGGAWLSHRNSARNGFSERTGCGWPGTR